MRQYVTFVVFIFVGLGHAQAETLCGPIPAHIDLVGEVNLPTINTELFIYQTKMHPPYSIYDSTFEFKISSEGNTVWAGVANASNPNATLEVCGAPIYLSVGNLRYSLKIKNTFDISLGPEPCVGDPGLFRN